MKTIFVATLTALALASNAFALENTVSPKVTSLKTENPKTGLYVGNSFTYYNCGVNGYVRGFTKEEKSRADARKY